MNNLEIEKRIEQLLDSYKYYLLSPYHRVYNDEDNDFFSLEKYLLETHIDEFSRKVSLMVIKLICYYKVYMELTEFPVKGKQDLFGISSYENFRDNELKLIDRIIREVVSKGKTSINIYFEKNNSLITISDDFQVVLFSNDTDFIEEIKVLSNSLGILAIENCKK